jgi:tripartite ATP-independent transporter DctP family solute receptor
LGAVLLLAAMPPAAAAETVTLRFSNVTSQSAIDGGVVFKEVAEKESGGSLKINLFDKNQLGDDRVVIEGTIFGDIDLAVSSTSPMATIWSDLYIFDSPYLFLTTDEAYAGMDGPVGRNILNNMSGKGLKGLAFWENGFRNFTNNKVAVKLPADVRGMKIRTMENEVHLAAWKALGANPTPMAFTELFTALQQGTVDGEENPLGIIDSNKFYEVQKYLSMTQHVYTPYILVMNNDKYNSLSSAQKAAIDKAALESTRFQRNRSQELEKETLVKVGKVGVVTLLGEADKQVWQNAVKAANIFDLVKRKMEHPSYIDDMLKK